ncbi:hypothetical protein ACFVJS_05940 [Nocardioides sp. NPDC057772]
MPPPTCVRAGFPAGGLRHLGRAAGAPGGRSHAGHGDILVEQIQAARAS